MLSNHAPSLKLSPLTKMENAYFYLPSDTNIIIQVNDVFTEPILNFF